MTVGIFYARHRHTLVCRHACNVHIHMRGDAQSKAGEQVQQKFTDVGSNSFQIDRRRMRHIK